MKLTIANFVKNEDYKVGDEVVLIGKRFSNRMATIKEVEADNKVAKVVTADDESEFRVDFNEMNPYHDQADIPDLPNVMNQSVEQGGENRPVGRGYGKVRDAFNVVGNALKKIEKE